MTSDLSVVWKLGVDTASGPDFLVIYGPSYTPWFFDAKTKQSLNRYSDDPNGK